MGLISLVSTGELVATLVLTNTNVPAQRATQDPTVKLVSDPCWAGPLYLHFLYTLFENQIGFLVFFLLDIKLSGQESGGWIWEDLGEEMTMIKIYCREFSKKKTKK